MVKKLASELVRELREGSNIRVNVTDYYQSELVEMSQAAKQGGGQFFIGNTRGIFDSQLQEIGRTGKGHVMMRDDGSRTCGNLEILARSGINIQVGEKRSENDRLLIARAHRTGELPSPPPVSSGEYVGSVRSSSEDGGPYGTGYWREPELPGQLFLTGALIGVVVGFVISLWQAERHSGTLVFDSLLDLYLIFGVFTIPLTLGILGAIIGAIVNWSNSR